MNIPQEKPPEMGALGVPAGFKPLSALLPNLPCRVSSYAPNLGVDPYWGSKYCSKHVHRL